jgi:ABC-type polar amino acid transport system ATPase subunit
LLSIGVSPALELSSVRKRFCVGAGACLASAEVLRGIDLDVGVAESVAVVGHPAAGKSTLLLCAAALLKPDSGEVRWFGERSRSVAAGRVRYYCTPADLASATAGGEPQLHLIDLHPHIDASHAIVAWIDERCAQGDSVVIAAQEERFIRCVATRVLVLSDGILRPTRSMRIRVAEHARA